MPLRPVSFPLPREHGSWVMFLLPPLLPLLALRRWSAATAPALLAMVLLFLAREPLRLRLRGAGGSAAALLPLAAGAAAGLVALALAPSRWLALWALAAALVLAVDLLPARAGRSTPGRLLARELAGVLGLTAGAPAVAAALGAPAAGQLAFWLLAWLPFSLGALHVDRFVAWRRSRAPEPARRRSALLLLAAASALGLAGFALLAELAPRSRVPAAAALAWSPEWLHLAWTAWHPRARSDFKRIGLEETLSGTLWLLTALLLTTA